MTYILGINDFHDTSAALLLDGKIIACAEEERFIRIKHAHGFFPYKSIEFCLQEANIKPSDVEYVAYFLNPKKFLKSLIPVWGMNIKSWLTNVYATLPIKEHFLMRLKKTGIKPTKIFWVDHHMAHACSAAMLSGFKKSMVLTLDNRGENVSTAGWYYNGEFEEAFHYDFPDSIGYLYQFITEYLGFEPNDGEWKTMGLAPYGEPDYILMKMFENYKKYLPNFGGYRLDLLEKDLKYSKRIPETDIIELHKNIAASIQKLTETSAMMLLKNLVENTKSHNLCLAGGVALNCKMNQSLKESGLISDIFIQPASGDAGTALGAALFACKELGIKAEQKLEHVYYGKEYSNEEIKKILDTSKLKYGYCNYDHNIAPTVAELIEKGNIVGWFQGRFEFGPRALGNRSILCDPRKVEMKDKINEVVKYRESWRPFAPSILSEDKDKYLKHPCEAPFMILTFDSISDDIPATVHVDNTTRPQTVEERINPKYYRLIKSFKNLTGVSALLNTSFNIRGQPIVNTPQEAIQTFYTTGLDVLILGDFILTK